MPSRCDSNTAPHLRPHHSLCIHTPATYNSYASAELSRYTSYTTLNPPYACVVPSQHSSNTAPSSLLTLPHPRRLQYIHTCSALNTPYSLSHPPNPLLQLPSLCSCSVLLACL
ncbi:hypothetical protein O181_020249 [Austropuccinia psidii MF-1]|uniref:Uncharacterized protein n=1 Tax=Austropuccinia psidii MF-1 TaxID=1389203 RepID=A0A9Q3GVI2_9BASI|nr:hypothetical protein [Austropuccinia psidii MF-1]